MSGRVGVIFCASPFSWQRSQNAAGQGQQLPLSASLQSKARGHFQVMSVHWSYHSLHAHELRLFHSPFTVRVSRRSLLGQVGLCLQNSRTKEP